MSRELCARFGHQCGSTSSVVEWAKLQFRNVSSVAHLNFVHLQRFTLAETHANSNWGSTNSGGKKKSSRGFSSHSHKIKPARITVVRLTEEDCATEVEEIDKGRFAAGTNLRPLRQPWPQAAACQTRGTQLPRNRPWLPTPAAVWGLKDDPAASPEVAVSPLCVVLLPDLLAPLHHSNLRRANVVEEGISERNSDRPFMPPRVAHSFLSPPCGGSAKAHTIHCARCGGVAVEFVIWWLSVVQERCLMVHVDKL